MKEFERKPVPDRITKFLQRWVELPYDGNLNSHFIDPPQMKITPEARERLQEHFREISRRRIGEDKASAAMWSRTSEKTSKLAMLHTLSKGENCTSIESAEWAIAVSNFLTRRLVALISGNVADSEHHRRVQKVLTTVKDAGIITQAELSRKTQWLSRKDRADISAQLIESGLMFSIFRDSATRSAAGYTADLDLLHRTQWKPMTKEISEKIRKGDTSMFST